MGLISTIIVAVIQGITELFPVSSLGHAVVLPVLLRLKEMDIRSEEFLPLLVVLHVGTAIALMLYFWRDWLGIASAFFDRNPVRRREQFRLLLLVIVGTIPAVIAGFLLERYVRSLFGTAAIAAFFSDRERRPALRGRAPEAGRPQPDRRTDDGGGRGHRALAMPGLDPRNLAARAPPLRAACCSV